jgi:general secretion pathway protein I
MILLSRPNKQSYSQQGFSLLEVLVAVAIISIALFAVIRSTQQASNTNAYLQDKIGANTVATDIMTNVRTKAMPLPTAGEQKTGDSAILGRTLYWTVRVESMGDSAIQRIIVTVTKDHKTPLASLTAYVAVDRDRIAIL